jgi:hypothetical protein
MTYGVADQFGDKERCGLVQVPESPQRQRIMHPAPRHTRRLASGG